MAGERRSRFGLAGSLALHAAVIAATFFTWQHRLNISDESPPVIPVDLVTIAAKTNIKAVAPKETFKAPKEPTAVTAPKVSENVPPPPQEVSAPKVEMAPPPLKPKPAPPKPEEAPSEPLVKAHVTPPPAVPKMRPRPPAPEKKKQSFNVNNILALLNKVQPSASSAKGERGARPHRGIGAQNAMTMDLQDALLNQIEQCWSPPVGAPNAADLIVEYEVFLNPDGSIAQPPRLSGEASSGPYMRAARDAARRAIYTCAPYKLPADQYSQWRDITMTFNPSKMVGQ